MGVTHQYQPFPKPECMTTVEQMQTKLEARVKAIKVNGGSGEVTGKNPEQHLPDGAKPSPPSSAILQWEKPKSKTATGVYTTCKRYSCAKITVDGKTSYELYKLVPGGGWFTVLNKGLDNFLQAQKLAEIDANKVKP